MEEQELKKIIGKRLASLRERDGLTQQEVADKIGISKSSVSVYENGMRDMTADIVSKVSDLFRVTLDYLFGRTNDDSFIAYKKMKDQECDHVQKAAFGGLPVVRGNETKAVDSMTNMIFLAMRLLDEGKITQEQFDRLTKKII